VTATLAFGVDFATLAASVTVIEPCCDSVVLLVSKKTIQAFVGGGGAAGGFCNDIVCGDSPQAVTRRAIANGAEKLLSILFSMGCYAHCA
jgi:hypothetical protein